jgi:hypothetical protein
MDFAANIAMLTFGAVALRLREPNASMRLHGPIAPYPTVMSDQLHRSERARSCDIR